jgi:FkbM family methyltransferase
MSTFRLLAARYICVLFPPVLAQLIRDKIFPLKFGQISSIDFSKKTITGSYFRGNTSDYQAHKVSVHGYFEWRNVVIADFFLRNTSGDVIEIGANVGTETISFCDIIKNKGVVHAFEPLPSNITQLEKLSESSKNLAIYPIAISNSEKIVQFQIPPSTFSGTGKVITGDIDNQNNTMEVETAPLDSFLNKFENVKFMSIDTEGHEPFVLSGSVKTIEKHQPAIIIEVSPALLKKYASATIKDIYDFFTIQNYLCYKINSFTLSPVDNTGFEDKSSNNWLCLPKHSQHRVNELSKVLFFRTICPWYLLSEIPN